MPLLLNSAEMHIADDVKVQQGALSWTETS